MRLPLSIVGPVYKSDSPIISSEECINFYLRPVPSVDYVEGKKKYVLIGTPGLTLLHDFKINSGIRGQLQYGNFLYIVVYNKFFRVNSDYFVEEIGTLQTSSGFVDLACNGIDITFVDGKYGYVYIIGSSSFQQITDVDFIGADVIRYTDGYYLVNRPNTGQIWRSDFNNGLGWGGLAFSTEGGDPDNLISIEIDGKDIWLFGGYTSSIWINIGVGQFNFAPINGTFIQEGIVSPFARCAVNNAIYWVSKTKKGKGEVFQSVARSPKVISSQPVMYNLSNSDLSNCYMWSYQKDGHCFIVIGIPSTETTWVYDSTVQEWHQRSSQINGVKKRSRSIWCSTFNELHVVGDCFEGKLYSLDNNVYDENGDPLIAVRTTGITRNKQNRITIDELILPIEKGVGLIDGENEDVNPQMMFSWSKDGGRNWSAEEDIPMGKIGEYDFIPKVSQLGQGIDWVFRIRVSAKVKRVILDGYILAEEDLE